MLPPMSALLVHDGILDGLITSTPLLRVLARRSGAPVDVLSTSPVAPVLYAQLPFVGSVQVWRQRWLPIWLSTEKRATLAWLRQRADAGLVLLTARPYGHLLGRAGLAVTAACGSHLLPRREDEHTVLHQLNIAACTPDGQDWDALRERDLNPLLELRVSQAEQADCHGWLQELGLATQQLLVVQPFDDQGRMAWPTSRWRQVINGLLQQETATTVLLLGSAGVPKWARDFSPERVRALSPQPLLRRLLALLAQARACLTVASSTAQLAAAVACPVVALFGATDPRVYRPMGPAVEVVTPLPMAQVPAGTTAWGRLCRLNGISPSAVLMAYGRLAGQR
jgi:heptosyltransferase III